MTVGIGSTIWAFDINRRVYAKDASNTFGGGPIWREHWRPMKVTGETSRSWITAWGKYPKSGGPNLAFSESDIDRAAFVNDHKHRICEAIRSEYDFDTLVQIAKLVGYKLPPQFATDTNCKT